MMTSWRALGLAVLTIALLLVGPANSLWAYQAAETETVVPEAASDAASVAAAPAEFTPDMERDYTINSLIMFLCAVLVLLMQAGFAMLEVGLNSQKNAVNILFKNLMDLSMGVLLYLLVGYALMYPGSDFEGKWFGYAGSPFVTRDAQPSEGGGWTAAPSSAGWSNSADFLFQVAFAATAATIVSGGVAGRMKFIAYLIYSCVITGLIYPISGMWKWGGGALAAMGFADFAGSVVVHAVGGFAALAGAIVLGPRIGRFKEGKSHPMPGHNLTFAALGVFILWIGWYGFNPGSQLTYAGAVNAETTTYIALTTTIAAAAGANAAMLIAWLRFGKPDLTMALNGALAGLVGITANCDQVTQVGAIIIGAVAGLLVFSGVLLLEALKIDDPVGAFPVHGLCGLWGGIATGLFGTKLPTITREGVEATLSRSEYILVQVQSSLIIAAWSFVTMLLVFTILKVLGILRVTPEEEIRGLDLSEHGMEAYVLT